VLNKGLGGMCGITGYVGRWPCQRLVLEGLRKLECRD